MTAAEAQAEYLTYLGLAPSAAVREIDGAYAVQTGAASNTENGVVARGPVADVAALVAWFDAPGSWLDLGGANHDALLAAGARPENNARDMIARIAELRLSPPDDVIVEPARTDEWFDFAAVHEWFGDPGERVAFERLYGELVGEQFRLFIAKLAGRTVGFAAAFYGTGFVLLTQVIVDEASRRRGVATALVAARLRAAGREFALLSPSPDGAKLYGALGFELRSTPPNRWYYLPCG